MTRLLRGRAFIDGALRSGVEIELDGATIRRVGSAGSAGYDDVILPGFIDLHVHGGDGADFMDGSSDAARKVLAFHARHGTTALAATTLTAPNAETRRALRGIVDAAIHVEDRSAEVVGVHLEGPYVNPQFAGAQNREALRLPSTRELEQFIAICGKLPLIMTIAPELPGAIQMIAAYRDRVIFSIGHSGATYAEAVAGVEAGAKHFTHLFNAMTPLHHREPGVVGAALVSPDTTFELIADGHHVHRAVLRAFAQSLNSRAVVVTDAMRACGMPPGSYKLFEHDVTVADGAARLGDGTLAGSVLTMFDAVKNMIELAGLPVEMVIPLATTNPAARLGIATRKGKIAAGYDADFVITTPDLQLKQVIVRGEAIS